MRILLKIVAALVLSGCATDGQYKREPSRIQALSRGQLDEVFLTAQLYIFADKMKEAERVLTAGIAGANGPGAIDFNLMLARVETELGKIDSAYKRYVDLANAHPKNETVLKEVAQFFYSIRLKEDAYGLYSRLVRLNPEESNYWIYKGLLALELANAKDAWKSFDYLVKHSRNAKHLGHLYMGKLMQMTGFQKKADRSFAICLKLKPETKECLYELSRSKYAKGARKGAISDVAKYLRKYKVRGNKDLAEQLIDWHIKSGDLKAAISEVENLERLNPSDVEIKRRLALLMVKDGDYGAALERMTVVINHDQSNERDNLNYVNILDLLGRVEESSIYLHQAALSEKGGEKTFFRHYKREKIKTNPSEARRSLASVCKKSRKKNECSYVHSYLLWEDGKVAAAKKNLEKTLRRGKAPLVKMKYFLSQIYYGEGAEKRALRLVDETLLEDENYAPALNFKSYHLANADLNLLEAEALALRALSQYPRNGHYMDTYGLILFKKGEMKEALVVLKEAVKLSPDEPEILERLADVYVAMQSFPDAVRFYTLASGLYKGENQDRVGGKLAQIQFAKKYKNKGQKRSISSVPDDSTAQSK